MKSRGWIEKGDCMNPSMAYLILVASGSQGGPGVVGLEHLEIIIEITSSIGRRPINLLIDKRSLLG
jgi:hypothetical protein